MEDLPPPSEPSMSIIPPPRKRRLWPAAAAVAIVLILIGSSLYILTLPKAQNHEQNDFLQVSLITSSSSVLTNESVELTHSVALVSATQGTKNVTETSTIRWRATPPNISMDFDELSKDPDHFPFYTIDGRLFLRAGLSAGVVVLTCNASYDNDGSILSDEASVTVTVRLHTFQSLSIEPNNVTMFLNHNVTVRATVLSDHGIEIPGATVQWRRAGTYPDCISLSRNSGSSVNVVGVAAGNATLIATVKYNGTFNQTVSEITVVKGSLNRTVDYIWYDMFNVPFGEWWQKRWNITHIEQPMTNSSPYIFRWHGSPLGNNVYYSNARLNIGGSNMDEISMSSRPVFLPFLGSERGGTAEINWTLRYMTSAELTNPSYRFPLSWVNDGWVVKWFGNVTLDEQAAKAVLNLTDSGFEAFDSWWAANNDSVSRAYKGWITNESSGRLNIRPMFTSNLYWAYWEFWCEKVGQNIVVHIDSASYGMEAMMTRWMNDAFMPTQWWFEDMGFEATITNDYCNLSIDTAVAYALKARESMVHPGLPCWIWEASLPDSISGPPGWYDPYASNTYNDTSVGSVLYGQWAPYDYTPAAFNLSYGERLIFEWGVGPYRFLAQAVNLSTGEPIIGQVWNLTSPMIANPVPGFDDIPNLEELISFCGCDSEHLLIYYGPFDAWAWSKTQTAHQWIRDGWDSSGMLPNGVPWVEFCYDEMNGTGLSLQVTVTPDPVLQGSPVDIQVSVLKPCGNLYANYTGTITFTSTDEYATLPENYTFTPADAGMHVFTGAAFWTAGVQNITVTDIEESLLSEVINITVDPLYFSRLEMSGIPSTVTQGIPQSLTVKALDQIACVYAGYRGSVEFSSNRSDIVLPTTYQFNESDEGLHVFTDELVFNGLGYYQVTCSEVGNPANGDSLEVFVVTSPPRGRLVISAQSEAAVGEWIDVTVTVYDQYDLVFGSYNGSITFGSDAPSSNCTLPSDYAFDPLVDMGSKTFPSAVRFTIDGTYSIAVNESVGVGISGDSVEVVVEGPHIKYKMYDMFQEPFGQWWWGNSPTYKGRIFKYQHEAILWNETRKHTLLYQPSFLEPHAVIMAPYHWETDADNIASVNVTNPFFMPSRYVDSLGTSAPTVANPHLSMDIRFQYMDEEWWFSYWVPKLPISPIIILPFLENQGDGYTIGTVYTLKMNREAALQWLNLSLSEPEGDIPAWWSASQVDYEFFWREWLVDQGNVVYDIYSGYEDTFYDYFLFSELSANQLTGDIELTLGHVGYGYEILMTRWLNASGLCSHETWWENFTLNATLGPQHSDVRFDATSFYNLHAVKANESAGNDGAWVWEPRMIDYVPSDYGPIYHPSDCDSYYNLRYTSWNSGDPRFGLSVPYLYFPKRFNLESRMTFEIDLPAGSDVPCYLGQGVSPFSIPDAKTRGILTNYTAISYNGTMSLGYWVSGGPDLDSMYDPMTKRLVIEGPLEFDNPRSTPGGLLYHGAPWIEFNVTTTLTEKVRS